MIEKIVEISNIGHFVNFVFNGSQSWNGQLKKVNTIYAPNGSGKTTLSTILKSLSVNNTDLIKFKKTFGASALPAVKIKQYLVPGLISLTPERWAANNLKIEVFDVNYIEDYLFAGSLTGKQNKTNLFKLLFGERGAQLKNSIKPKANKLDRLTKDLSRDRRNDELRTEQQLAAQELAPLLQEFDEFTVPIYRRHIELVNKYLLKFTSYIQLTEFSHLQNSSAFERFRIFPVFEVYGEKVVFATPNINSNMGNARYSMSEGDKSTIALCFFLARLELLGVQDKIIVFDDPLSSFDYSRRTSTIFQLAKIATDAVQFILLTHDLGFAADFVDKCSFLDSTTLKITNDGTTSRLAWFDINAEFLTPTQKDLEVIRTFLNSGDSSDAGKREVIRCIRPTLEGVLKTKYFEIIPNNIWLGEIIELIKAAQQSSRLFKLKGLAEDLIELNDYTKSFHHSSGDNRQMIVDNGELSRYIQLMMRTIDEI
ncbi:AAA family ATPase [Sphingobacterium sp. HSC-15S19]|uniref:AAA family ATPase n=1 Tax=Sphingobacterium TaxID=28453 RepID=UPI003D194E5F